MTKLEILQEQLKDTNEELRTLKNYIKRLESEYEILHKKYSNLQLKEEVYKALGVNVIDSKIFEELGK